MAIGDILKKFRGGDDGDKAPPKDKKESEAEGTTPRLIKLSDEEQKAFEGSKPGEDVAAEVHGTLDGDGMFRVMSLAPSGGMKPPEQMEQDMAGQVAQKVSPTIQPSVS